jgi:hypothetical protein
MAKVPPRVPGRNAFPAPEATGGGKPYATLVVAASDSVATAAASADYVCDGTGDQVEINAALAALGGPGRVVLLEGTFHLAEGITMSSGAALVGQGMDATTVIFDQFAGGAPWFVLYSFNVSNVLVADLCLDGNSDTGLFGVYFDDPYITFQRVRIQHMPCQVNCALDLANADHVRVQDCEFYDTINGAGAIAVGAYSIITGNRMVDIADEGVLTGPSCLIANNIGENVGTAGGTPPGDFINAGNDSIVTGNWGQGSTATATIVVGTGGVNANNVLL